RHVVPSGSSSRPVSCSLSVFFFSSRRRHTRFSRDWSSDVCSSDLVELDHLDGAEVVQLYVAPKTGGAYRPVRELKGFSKIHLKRSEERRVGKECRSRWSPGQQKKNIKVEMSR